MAQTASCLVFFVFFDNIPLYIAGFLHVGVCLRVKLQSISLKEKSVGGWGERAREREREREGGREGGKEQARERHSKKE